MSNKDIKVDGNICKPETVNINLSSVNLVTNPITTFADTRIKTGVVTFCIGSDDYL